MLTRSSAVADKLHDVFAVDIVNGVLLEKVDKFCYLGDIHSFIHFIQ